MLPTLIGSKAPNVLLSTLNISIADKLIALKENHNADANFILTNLIKQILNNNNKLCLVMLHNSIEHYRVVGKKLGYDLTKHIEEDCVKTIAPLTSIANAIGEEDCDYLTSDGERPSKALFLDIKRNIDSLRADNSKVYIIIDDLSHLLDLGVDLKYIVSFINCCVNLTSDESVHVVINVHVGSKSDEILLNALSYVADVIAEVSPLKTGRSSDVTGVISVKRKEQVGSNLSNVYHYKAYDRGVRVFHPGESVNYLYK